MFDLILGAVVATLCAFAVGGILFVLIVIARAVLGSLGQKNGDL